MADIPPAVLQKLIVFTGLMVLGPLAVFFLLQAAGADSLVSGGAAAVAANAVLIGYVYLAFNEEIPVDEKKKD